MTYVRTYFKTLFRRLSETRRFIQVVAGPRQVGKIRLEAFFSTYQRDLSQFKFNRDEANER